jgi:hypothetical protein
MVVDLLDLMILMILSLFRNSNRIHRETESFLLTTD